MSMRWIAPVNGKCDRVVFSDRRQRVLADVERFDAEAREDLLLNRAFSGRFPVHRTGSRWPEIGFSLSG